MCVCVKDARFAPRPVLGSFSFRIVLFSLAGPELPLPVQVVSEAFGGTPAKLHAGNRHLHLVVSQLRRYVF